LVAIMADTNRYREPQLVQLEYEPKTAPLGIGGLFRQFRGSDFFAQASVWLGMTTVGNFSLCLCANALHWQMPPAVDVIFGIAAIAAPVGVIYSIISLFLWGRSQWAWLGLVLNLSPMFLIAVSWLIFR
jgi:hypothetical protein